MAAFLYIFRSEEVIVLVPAGAIIYFACILIFRAVDGNDIGLIKKALGRKAEK